MVYYSDDEVDGDEWSSDEKEDVHTKKNPFPFLKYMYIFLALRCQY